MEINITTLFCPLKIRQGFTANMQLLCYVTNLNLKHKLFQMFSPQVALNLEHWALNIQVEKFWCTRLRVERSRSCLFLCHFRCFPDLSHHFPDMSSSRIWQKSCQLIRKEPWWHLLLLIPKWIPHPGITQPSQIWDK